MKNLLPIYYLRARICYLALGPRVTTRIIRNYPQPQRLESATSFAAARYSSGGTSNSISAEKQ